MDCEGPIVFFFRAFRLRYPFLRSNCETTCRLAGVPNLSSRREICPRDRLVYFTSARIGSPAVWSSITLKKFASRSADISTSFLRPAPFFGHDSYPDWRFLPVPPASADGLGIALQNVVDVLDPAMTQLCGLDGRIPSTIILGQRLEQRLHHPFNSSRIGIHATLLGVGFRSNRLIPYFKKLGKLFPSRS